MTITFGSTLHFLLKYKSTKPVTEGGVLLRNLSTTRKQAFIPPQASKKKNIQTAFQLTTFPWAFNSIYV